MYKEHFKIQVSSWYKPFLNLSLTNINAICITNFCWLFRISIKLFFLWSKKIMSAIYHSSIYINYLVFSSYSIKKMWNVLSVDSFLINLNFFSHNWIEIVYGLFEKSRMKIDTGCNNFFCVEFDWEKTEFPVFVSLVSLIKVLTQLITNLLNTLFD